MKNVIAKDDFQNLLAEAKILSASELDQTSYDFSLSSDFGFVFSKNVVDFFAEICAITGDNAFAFLVLDPDPVGYFYEHFRKFPCIEFSADDRKDLYFSELSRDPGGSPADAISYNSNVIAIFPRSKNWYMICDRSNDSTIVRSKFQMSKKAIALVGADPRSTDVT